MQKYTSQITVQQAAIVSGIAIVLMTLASVVATDISIGKLYLPDDPATTFNNIGKHLLLFKVGILSWMVVLFSDVLVAWGLYIFLRPINKELSLLAAWLRLIYTAILGTSILNLVYVPPLFHDMKYSSVLGTEQLEQQTSFYLDSFYSNWHLGLLVFGLHIFLLGYLGLRSGAIPKFISVFLLVGGVGYLLINVTELLIPQYQNLLTVLQWIFIVPMLFEVVLGVWLLWKGRRVTTL